MIMELPTSRFLPWLVITMIGLVVSMLQTSKFCTTTHPNWYVVWTRFPFSFHYSVSSEIMHTSSIAPIWKRIPWPTRNSYTKLCVGWCQMLVTQLSKVAADFPNQKHQKWRLQYTAKRKKIASILYTYVKRWIYKFSL